MTDFLKGILDRNGIKDPDAFLRDRDNDTPIDDTPRIDCVPVKSMKRYPVTDFLKSVLDRNGIKDPDAFLRDRDNDTPIDDTPRIDCVPVKSMKDS